MFEEEVCVSASVGCKGFTFEATLCASVEYDATHVTSEASTLVSDEAGTCPERGMPPSL